MFTQKLSPTIVTGLASKQASAPFCKTWTEDDVPKIKESQQYVNVTNVMENHNKNAIMGNIRTTKAKTA